MRPLDRDIVNCRALVVDCNATSRSILVAQLRDFGVGTVVQCGRVIDARMQLELRQYDVVLCEQGFHGTEYSGQQLLDDLRRHQLLPLSTVFIMITSEATYAKVAEAAESALDSYLLKPHTAAALGERLMQARRRKTVLKAVFEAIDAGDFETAALQCQQRFAGRDEYWLFAARIGAELLLNLGRHAEAKAMFDSIVEAQAVPWAKLGIARTQVDAGELKRATRTLESLIDAHPTFVDAYDVMGRVHVEQGNLEQALAVYREAAALTPGSVGRLQKLGMLASYAGDCDEAARALERATSLGISSKMFDFQSVVLLAFARFQQGDSKGLQRCLDNVAHALSKSPASSRLQRFDQTVRVLTLMQQRQVGEAVQQIRELGSGCRSESFDVEAGCNFLQLIALMSGAELQLDGVDDWVDTVGMRHCTSKMLTELLQRSASAHPPFSEHIKACHQRIFHTAEQAMAHSLAGHPEAAAKALLEHGRSTLNGKLLDTARAVLQRHHDRIDGADTIAAAVEAVRVSHCGGNGKPPLGDGQRKAGGLALRTKSAEPA